MHVGCVTFDCRHPVYDILSMLSGGGGGGIVVADEAAHNMQPWPQYAYLPQCQGID